MFWFLVDLVTFIPYNIDSKESRESHNNENRQNTL